MSSFKLYPYWHELNEKKLRVILSSKITPLTKIRTESENYQFEHEQLKKNETKSIFFIWYAYFQNFFFQNLLKLYSKNNVTDMET